MRTICFTIALSLVMTACQSQPKSDASTPENARLTTIVQDASITDLEGNLVNLDDYKGKIVMLDFWETWCTPCIRSFPGMAKAMMEHPDDFVILAISPGFMDSEDDMRTFIDENPYPFIWATGVDLATDLGIEGIPYKVFLDRDGNVHSVEMGSRGPERDYEKLVELIGSLPN